ncbi:uncharacterized protein LOC106179456 [Lingula anatina]|uniref:Uncharacterized protein LOC106179456 n=1 Tax=Lingula anatina TaxID=7574 RepID=A0A1S3K7R5_LINAN|nr:uncharacterized protein LOC106179456 [Lingula anatina]|eukprot:XP_013418537.1 uncharacterized protein LOC106179456 [Lingula anatina]
MTSKVKEMTSPYRLRMTQPKPCPPDVAIVVFFHGGGWVICSRKTHDPALKLLTDTVGCIFVSVEYRLAPEHKFPAALEDAEVAVRWCMENKEKIGGSVSSKIGVCGDSAGGHLAASAAHDVPGVSFQVKYLTDLNVF